MTTLRAIFPAFGPESLERYPTLPTVPRKVISAIPHCRSGHYGDSLSPCPSGGEHHRVNHACGNRHCPPCQQHTTQQWLAPHLDTQLPGPHFLLTCTVPETRRPFLRSHQRIAYHAMFHASSKALKRLAKDARCIGTDLPGFLGVLHPWGRQLQSHPHIHSMVPGGGLAEDRMTWLPARANCSVPVTALSPISRALCKEDMDQAGLLAHIAPLVWTLPWNVHRQANHHGRSAFTSLAPSVFRVALAKNRIVSLTGRTVTFTSRTPGSARPRTTRLDALAFLRRFRQHVLPDGFLQVRQFGLLHASCAIPPDTLRLLIVQAHSIDLKPTPRVPSEPLAALCPTCGTPMHVVMRLWPSNRAFVDTG